MRAALDTIMQQESALLLPTYERFPILFERGEGVFLYDSEGRRYVDFLSGIGVNALGYGHPAIQSAIADQAGRLIHVSNLFYHAYQAPLAAKLAALSGLDRAFFCNSGTEAWEGALKLARAHGRRRGGDAPAASTRLLVMENSFHGRTLGSLATTGTEKYRAPFAPMLPGVTFVRFNDVDDLKANFDETVCTIGLETIQGEGGVHPVSPEFLMTARALTRQTGALLMLDEIQCGLGRTGRMFAYQHYDVRPDVVTVAKPLAAGLPLGAILTTHEVADCFQPGMHGTTFGGGPLACAAALAFLDEIARPGFLESVARVGAHFRERLLDLQDRRPCIREVRAVGLMLAAELDSSDLARAVVKGMLARGYVINRTHDHVLRFLPPYVIEREHVDGLTAALDELLAGGQRNA
jgi:acetylornithine aminotransferase/acetylornithine/N-succinyldiaminopimelate aminotransferase